MISKATASSFSISRLLDADSQTRKRFPVVEIPVADIADHPGNAAYSMEDVSIMELADSIRRDGLTDLPLVRKLPDGSYQMLSGHRRKAAYILLAEDDPAFTKLPCRIIDGISDDEALVLLHTANFFVRQLNVVERAAASKALGLEVERLRAADPSLKGKRTEDIKAAIVTAQTGAKVSGKTIQRREALARKVESDLIEEWRAQALAGNLSDSRIRELASMDEDDQRKALSGDANAKSTSASAGIARLVASAERSLAKAVKSENIEPSDIDAALLASIRKNLERLEGVRS